MKLKNFFKIFKTNKKVKVFKNYVSSKTNILEIGVHLGSFSEVLLKQFNPKKLFLVDPWKYETNKTYLNSWYGGKSSFEEGQRLMDQRYDEIKFKFQKELKSGQITLIRKNSDDAFNKLENNYFDLIYLDGNHTYDFIRKDILNSLLKIKKSGIIVCDDYNNSGWWNDGVTKAVDQLCDENIIKKIKVKNSQCVIQKVLV